MKFQYSDLLVRDLHTNRCNTLRSSTGSLTLLLHLVCIKVSASLATALIPPHVLAQVLLADHPAVHCPLVACALVRESSFGQEKRGETSRLAREQHCGCDKNHCTWGKKGPVSLSALDQMMVLPKYQAFGSAHCKGVAGHDCRSTGLLTLSLFCLSDKQAWMTKPSKALA